MILTIALITTIFYFHPSTSSAVSVFRTVTIRPETNGRVAETYVNINQRVAQGQPLFRLDDREQATPNWRDTRAVLNRAVGFDLPPRIWALASWSLPPLR